MKLDLGCGKNKKEGFVGVDSISFPGVDVVADLVKPILKPLPDHLVEYADLLERKAEGFENWPWDDSSVDEAHASHFVEHLRPRERIHFSNELYRVLQPGAKATIIVPHWKSCRAYGDMTHTWPPVSEFWFYYLKKEWRLQNAPHNDADHVAWGYRCDFEVTWGYSLDQPLLLRNQEYQQHAIRYFTESTQDIVATFTSLKKA